MKKKIIIIIVIIIIICSLLIYILRNKFKTENLYNPKVVSDNLEYFSISNIIQQYYIAINNNDIEQIYSLLDEEYINKYTITLESLSKDIDQNKEYFLPQKIYYYDLDEYSRIYYIQGVSYKRLNDNNKKEFKDNICYIVKVDKYNETFSISKDLKKYETIFK